jgi:hypothetical protein
LRNEGAEQRTAFSATLLISIKQFKAADID